MTEIKQKLIAAGLLNAISWADISRDYFNKSNSWLYHKLNGEDRNGNQLQFSDEELQQLKESLNDLSKRIASLSESL